MAEAVTPSERSPHAQRFALLIGALIGIAIGAIALAAVLVANGSDGPGPEWSAWRPAGHDLEAAQEIAEHVSHDYRLPNGDQLVTVIGGPLEIADLPAHLAKRSTSGAISILDGSTVLFTLCGNGSRCAFRTGKPSIERGLLLYREALELALYSFRYLDVENVVALLPPRYVLAEGAGKRARLKPQSRALLLHRNQFATSLDRPLSETLSPDAPSMATIERAPEARLVGAVTETSLFRMRLVEAQDASAVVLLEPLPK